MDKFKLLLKKHLQQIMLVVGYIAVAALAFGLGTFNSKAPQNLVTQTPNPLPNYNPNISSTQTEIRAADSTTGATNCQGRIKGSSSLIYHVPGSTFYDKTTKPIKCFDTESEAAATGFRKSSR